MDKRLENLKSLSTTLLDIELFKLKDIALKQKRISDELLKIRDDQSQQSIRMTDPESVDASLFVGAHSKWETWCIKKSMSLNQEQASLRVEMEKQRKKSRKMFGRSEAVKELMKRDRDLAKKRESP